MKSVKPIILMLCVAVLATSCDFVRSSLGKPTSKDLAVVRAKLASAERLADSLAKAEADSVAEAAEADSIAKSALSPGMALEKPFYIAGGSFSVKENAVKMASKFKTDGLNPVITRFRNGFYVVLAEGFDSREAGEAALKRVPYSGYGPGVVVLYRRTQDLVVESTE
jgi:hypothetical protein